MIWRPLLGICVFTALTYIFSEDKKKFPFKLFLLGLGLQVSLAFLLLKMPLITYLFSFLNKPVLMIDQATKYGSQFMLGYLAGGEAPFEIINAPANFIIVFQVLPIVLVMSALTSILFHFGIIQKVIRFFSYLLEKSLYISGIQAMSVSVSIFLGIVEAPLFVKPYLEKVSRSTLFLIMTSGMATVAGTVMVLYANILKDAIENPLSHILIASFISAPASIVIAKALIPDSSTNENIEIEDVKIQTTSWLDALVKGAMEGVQLILSIAALIIILFALVDLANQVLSFIHQGFTLQLLLSYLFKPFVWLMGIPWSEVSVASELMATKTLLNEFVSYQQLASLQEAKSLSKLSQTVLLYAMCGFANLASVGLIVGTISSLAPSRRSEVASLGFKSLFSGTLATMMTGAIASLIL